MSTTLKKVITLDGIRSRIKKATTTVAMSKIESDAELLKPEEYAIAMDEINHQVNYLTWKSKK